MVSTCARRTRYCLYVYMCKYIMLQSINLFYAGFIDSEFSTGRDRLVKVGNRGMLTALSSTLGELFTGHFIIMFLYIFLCRSRYFPFRFCSLKTVKNN